MKKYVVSDFSSETEYKDAVLSDGSLTDIEKLNLIFNVSKEKLKNTNVQLYYAILAVLDSSKKSSPPLEYFQ